MIGSDGHDAVSRFRARPRVPSPSQIGQHGAATLPPALPEELIQEILLRLPPDDPLCLLRASLVCKPWRRVVSHPDFLRRLRAPHRIPPVLGFIHNLSEKHIPQFVPTTASAFSLPTPDRRSWRALDCRQGRAFFFSSNTRDLLVWDPITGDQRHVPAPAEFKIDFYNAAVVCAPNGCDHRDCHWGAFRVVFVFTDFQWVTSVCVYSSETSAWGELTSFFRDPWPVIEMKPRPLVWKSLMYILFARGYILEYNLAGRGFVVIDPPVAFATYTGSIVLMPAEDGGWGVAGVKESCLYLWCWEASNKGDARWVQSRAIDVGNLLPVAALSASAEVIGFAVEANVIFLSTVSGVFAIELDSRRVSKVCKRAAFHILIPFCGFYIPGKRAAAAGWGEGTIDSCT